MVHVSTMADDYYRFVEGAHLLRGENTHKVYRLGDKVKVQVIRVNMEMRQVDLGLVEILERVRRRRARAAPQQGGAEARREAQAAPRPQRAASEATADGRQPESRRAHERRERVSLAA